MKIPFRDINVNTLPVAGSLKAAVKEKPHIIFLGAGNSQNVTVHPVLGAGGRATGISHRPHQQENSLPVKCATLTSVCNKKPLGNAHNISPVYKKPLDHVAIKDTLHKSATLSTLTRGKTDQFKGMQKSSDVCNAAPRKYHSKVDPGLIDFREKSTDALESPPEQPENSLHQIKCAAASSVSTKPPDCVVIDDTLHTSTSTDTDHLEKSTDVEVVNELSDGGDLSDALSDDFEPVKKPARGSSKVNSRKSEVPPEDVTSQSELMEILPKGYDYKNVMLESSISNSRKSKNFRATFRVNIFSQKDAEKWKVDFEKSSYSDYRVMKAWKYEESPRVIFKKKYRCHHNTLAEKSGSKKAHEKHTKCPAQVTVTVKNPSMQWSTDELLKTHPTEILINFTHNHYIDSLAGDILRHSRPAPEVVDHFTKLFTNSRVYHSPSSAMDAYLADIELDPFSIEVGDGATVPTMAWVQKLFKKLTKFKCGDQYGPGMLEALKKYVAEYNAECGGSEDEVFAEVVVTDDGQNHFVTVCSPMMKRIHTHHKASGEVMFIDSTGSMDSNNARVFMMLTPSVAGGLQLGMLITFSEKEDVVTAALQSWKKLLPKHAFYGRGAEKGPKIIISEDSPSERNSLRLCFPEATLLLCIFHVLQATPNIKISGPLF